MKFNSITKSQIFKNYKELCEFLEEPVKGGTSKEAQIKEWQRYFAFERQGNKYIITEIYDTPLEKVRKERKKETQKRKKCKDTSNYKGNNNKNINQMLAYIKMIDIDDEYYSWTKVYTEVLQLYNDIPCDIVYSEKEELEAYCKSYGIDNYEALCDYVSAAKQGLKKLLLKTLDVMGFEYKKAYKFIYAMGNKVKGSVITDKINDKILKIEEEACNYLNSYAVGKRTGRLSTKLKGRQLLLIIYSNKTLREKFNKYVIDAILKDGELFKLISEENREQHFLGLINAHNLSEYVHPIIRYSEVLNVRGVYAEEDFSEETAKETSNMIRRKARKQIEKKGYKEEDILKVEKLLFCFFDKSFGNNQII